MNTRILSRLGVALVLPATALAQGPNYPDFSSVAGLAIVGDAAQAGTTMRVTSESLQQVGAVWYDTPVAVSGGFETTFVFQITNPVCGGADGMAFVIHNDPRGTTAIGEPGTALGYSENPVPIGGTAIENSLVVELDTWNSGVPVNDLSGNEISVHTMGVAANMPHESASIGGVDLVGTNMSDGLPHTVRISYTPGTLDIYIDDLITPVLTTSYDFATGGTHTAGTTVGGLNLLPGGEAIIGLTASTGGCAENHDLLSWTYGNGALGTNYCTAAPNTTGSIGVCEAFGSRVASLNDFTLSATGLPNNQFGIFVTSSVQGFSVGAGGTSNGNVCLSGTIGRFNQTGQILSTGGMGSFSLPISLTSIPQGASFVSVTSGQTWNFQAWHRDSSGLGSNFTNGLEVMFL